MRLGKALTVPAKLPNNWANGPANITRPVGNARLSFIRLLLSVWATWPAPRATLHPISLAPRVKLRRGRRELWLPRLMPARKPTRKKNARPKCQVASRLLRSTTRNPTDGLAIADCRLEEIGNRKILGKDRKQIKPNALRASIQHQRPHVLGNGRHCPVVYHHGDRDGFDRRVC